MQINSVRVTRDSLNPLEQLKAPHAFVASLLSAQTVEELLLKTFQKLKAEDRVYATATWSITSKRPLAVVAAKWGQPRILLRSVRRIQDTVIVQDNTAYLHFCLHDTNDPETLYQTLDRLSFPYLGESKT